MLSLHHAHIFASDIEATIAFWRDNFDARVMLDAEFAGARNVFLRVGEGRLHLYAQPPRLVGQGTVHYLGVETDDAEPRSSGNRLRTVSCMIKARPRIGIAMIVFIKLVWSVGSGC